jgi:NADPH-dependent 2,4-dienoyl-CoA reductase/sulfur reductase-like enzyme
LSGKAVTKQISEPARKTIVYKEADIVVVGGGVAGVSAAALAVKAGVTPRKVNVKALQKQLLKQGALLEGVKV